MAQFVVVLEQVVSFCMMMVVGYIGVRMHVMDEQFLGKLSRLITRIILPILIFTNAMRGITREKLLGGMSFLVIGACVYLVLAVMMYVVARCFRLEKGYGRVYRATFSLGNVGFIGIPLLNALFPENAAMYVSLLTLVDQLFLWTYGVRMTTPQEKMQKFSFKSFVNPALCAVALALVLIVSGFTLPDVFLSPLETIGKSATPLSLIYLGGLFQYCDFSKVLRAREVYTGIVLKMLVLPVVTYAVLTQITSVEIARVLAVVVALPTMTTIAMFAKNEDNEGDFALGVVLLTTAVSLFSMTAVSYFIF